MIKQVTLVKVYKNETKKDGTPYEIKNGKDAGKKFTRVGIQAEGIEGTYYNNARLDSREINLEEGQSYLLKLYEEKSKDGSTIFKNFKFPTKAELEVYEQFVKDNT